MYFLSGERVWSLPFYCSTIQACIACWVCVHGFCYFSGNHRSKNHLPWLFLNTTNANKKPTAWLARNGFFFFKIFTIPPNERTAYKFESTGITTIAVHKEHISSTKSNGTATLEIMQKSSPANWKTRIFPDAVVVDIFLWLFFSSYRFWFGHCTRNSHLSLIHISYICKKTYRCVFVYV